MADNDPSSPEKANLEVEKELRKSIPCEPPKTTLPQKLKASRYFSVQKIVDNNFHYE